MVQGGPIVRGGLAMRTQRRRLAGRLGRVAAHGCDVAGPGRVVDQPGGGYRAATSLEHPAQDGRVQRPRAARRQRVSTASRASSWRNIITSPCGRISPDATQSSRRFGVGAAGSSSSQRSTRLGTTEQSSRTARACGESRRARASVASRTVTGMLPGGLASSSVTQKGLPPVCAWIRSAGRPACWARRATAASDKG